jgi:crotonobetainyl-CoA:carnitine CoA-transferase CaiB-like acyl-CoA transferase
MSEVDKRTRTQALDGVIVLDLARGYPPAQSTMFLGDFGARVIKIDSPKGNKIEIAAGIDPGDERYAALNRLNRNKETVVINLRNDEGLKVFYRLVKKADVLVEGFRPGAMKRLRADYDTLKDINPRLIYCSMSGYGSDGPYARLPGHDPCYLGIAGALSMIGPRSGKPCTPSNYIGDMGGAAMHGLVGILIALIARDKTGQGQFIDISYTDGVISLMEYDILSYLFTGTVPRRGETFMTGLPAWSNVYKCKDGEYFVIACGEPQFWKNLCRALGREDLIWYHGAPPEKQETGIRELAGIFLTKTRDEWWDFLKNQDTSVAPVYNIDETLDDPQVRHRQMLLEINHPTLGLLKQLGFAIKLSETPARIRSFGKVVGSDTQKIMEELGYSRGDIQRLLKEGTIGCRDNNG